jgi:antimicrobial peptide system SdpA family protein
LGAVVIAVGLAWVVAIGYSIHPALPYSPVRLPYASQAHTFLWAPQGWSFFTRDPREEKRTVYVRRGSSWESALLAPHQRPANLGGLRRKSRAQLLEVGRLINNLPEDAWQSCDVSLQECLARLPQGRAVRNTTPEPTLCGTTAIVLQRLVPWAWAGSSRPVTMPMRVVALEVSC